MQTRPIQIPQAPSWANIGEDFDSASLQATEIGNWNMESSNDGTTWSASPDPRTSVQGGIDPFTNAAVAAGEIIEISSLSAARYHRVNAVAGPTVATLAHTRYGSTH